MSFRDCSRGSQVTGLFDVLTPVEYVCISVFLSFFLPPLFTFYLTFEHGHEHKRILRKIRVTTWDIVKLFIIGLEFMIKFFTFLLFDYVAK